MNRIYLFMCYCCQRVYAGIPECPPECKDHPNAAMLKIQENQTAFYTE